MTQQRPGHIIRIQTCETEEVTYLKGGPFTPWDAPSARKAARRALNRLANTDFVAKSTYIFDANEDPDMGADSFELCSPGGYTYAWATVVRSKWAVATKQNPIQV